MSTQITAPETAGTSGIRRADSNALMRALSVGEQVAARLPHLPDDIKLSDNYRGAYVVDLYFHRRPDLVGEMAAVLGVEVQARPHDETRTYTFADVVVDGVAVHAWALTDTEPVAVAA